VRATGGTIVSVADEQIAAARQELADEGLFVEPTAAVCFAAVRAAVDQTFDPDSLTWAGAASLLTAATVVVPLCGAGLKSPGDSTPMQAILPE
jgi:threonine synthase